MFKCTIPQKTCKKVPRNLQKLRAEKKATFLILCENRVYQNICILHISLGEVYLFTTYCNNRVINLLVLWKAIIVILLFVFLPHLFFIYEKLVIQRVHEHNIKMNKYYDILSIIIFICGKIKKNLLLFESISKIKFKNRILKSNNDFERTSSASKVDIEIVLKQFDRTH